MKKKRNKKEQMEQVPKGKDRLLYTELLDENALLWHIQFGNRLVWVPKRLGMIDKAAGEILIRSDFVIKRNLGGFALGDS
jgi:hypothetical protein